jgi:hypothetical protein
MSSLRVALLQVCEMVGWPVSLGEAAIASTTFYPC